MATLDPHHVRRVTQTGGPQKQVLWVRHGQSIADDQRSVTDPESSDPRWLDAQLSPLGRKQASSWAGVAPTWKVQEVLCSPLTRALESACRVFSHTSVDIHVTPRAREGWWFSTENRGRLRSGLEAGTESGDGGSPHWTPLHELPGAHKLRGLERIEAPVPGEWDPLGEEERAADEDGLFSDWRRGLEELKLELLHSSASRIAVVTHWGVIEALTGVGCANGSIVPTLVQSSGDAKAWQCTVCGPIMEHPPLGVRTRTWRARHHTPRFRTRAPPNRPPTPPLHSRARPASPPGISAYDQVEHLSTPASPMGMGSSPGEAFS